MRLFKLTWLLVCGLLTSICQGQTALHEGATAPHEADWATSEEVGNVLTFLRNGGYVLVLRHGATDRTQKDLPKPDLEDCDTQRNLTDIGRLNASGWGRVLRDAEVPVAMVVSGQYCRTRETAERLGFKTVAVDGRLNAPADREEVQQRGKELQGLVNQVPPRGANVILVTHSANLVAAFETDVAGIDEGDAIVMRPSAGAATIVAKLHIADVAKWRQRQAIGRLPRTNQQGAFAP